MTLSELISEVGDLRPHQYSADQLTDWVNAVESRAISDVINRARGDDIEWTPYTYAEDAERTLLIPDDHKLIYQAYIFAMADYLNAEYDRYSADAAMYEAAWESYAAKYRREHRPKDYEITVHPCPHPLF